MGKIRLVFGGEMFGNYIDDSLQLKRRNND